MPRPPRAQALALTRGTSAPYTTTMSAIDAAAGTLQTAKITTTLTVNGSGCTSKSCSVSTAGQIAQVQLTYPCNLTVMGINFGGKVCTLTSQSADVVQ